jgi:hypothetical protein
MEMGDDTQRLDHVHSSEYLIGAESLGQRVNNFGGGLPLAVGLNRFSMTT